METAVLVAVISAAAATFTAIFAAWTASQRSRKDRQRDLFASAFSDCMVYREFPFAIRRRAKSDGEGERQRLSEELRHVQARLAHHRAWIASESRWVAVHYENLLAETRLVAGGLMHDAWNEAPSAEDKGMNLPAIGLQLGTLAPFDDAFIQAVRDHFSFFPVWVHRLRRRVAKTQTGVPPKDSVDP